MLYARAVKAWSGKRHDLPHDCAVACSAHCESYSFIHSFITCFPMSLVDGLLLSSVPFLHSASIAARLSSHIHTHIPIHNMHCILAIYQCQCPGALDVSSASNAIKTPSKLLGHLAITWPCACRTPLTDHFMSTKRTFLCKQNRSSC